MVWLKLCTINSHKDHGINLKIEGELESVSKDIKVRFTEKQPEGDINSVYFLTHPKTEEGKYVKYDLHLICCAADDYTGKSMFSLNTQDFHSTTFTTGSENWYIVFNLFDQFLNLLTEVFESGGLEQENLRLMGEFNENTKGKKSLERQAMFQDWVTKAVMSVTVKELIEKIKTLSDKTNTWEDVKLLKTAIENDITGSLMIELKDRLNCAKVFSHLIEIDLYGYFKLQQSTKEELLNRLEHQMKVIIEANPGSIDLPTINDGKTFREAFTKGIGEFLSTIPPKTKKLKLNDENPE